MVQKRKLFTGGKGDIHEYIVLEDELHEAQFLENSKSIFLAFKKSGKLDVDNVEIYCAKYQCKIRCLFSSEKMTNV